LLTVDLESTDPAFAGTVLVKVIQSKPYPGRRWMIGCVFTQKPVPDEMMAGG
jgi:hypothetical protein